MSLYSRLTTAALGLLLCVSAMAGEGERRLQDFVDNVRTLEAEFDQVLIDPAGRATQSSSGTLYISRPGRFRWDYRKPYPQLILADGQRVWVHDPDLEQATVKPLDEALGNTPAALLSGTEPVDRAFAVVEIDGPDELAWVELTPKSGDSTFERLRLGFDHNTLRAMELLDNFGQKTLFEFHDIRSNQPLDDSLFVFNPPPGTDVIGE